MGMTPCRTARQNINRRGQGLEPVSTSAETFDNSLYVAHTHYHVPRGGEGHSGCGHVLVLLCMYWYRTGMHGIDPPM